MNEQEGVMEELFNYEESNVTEYATVDNTEEIGETGEEPEETTENGSSEYGTDSGEVLETESAHSEEILNEIRYNNELLETIIEIQEREPRTIFNTPIAEYNVLEGMTMILVLILMTTIIFGMVGGIIKWRE